jgi:hypothetical protein
LELTRITDQPTTTHPIIMLPLIYDMGSHILQLAERRDVNTPVMIMQAVSMQLRKFLDKRGGITGEPLLYASVLDLLSNLQLPIPQQMPPQMQPGQMQPSQFISPGMPQQMMEQQQMNPQNPMNPMNMNNMGQPE